MKNGFTLVELLAVIVILAVIALIATPVVLSIIDDAKESAMLRSAEMYLSGVENAVMRENMNSGGNFRPNECTILNGNMTCGSTNIEVEVDGEVPSTGSIVFENGKIKEVTLNYTSGTIVKDSSGNLVYEGTTTEKTLDTLCTYDATNGVAEKTAGAKYTCEVKEGTSYNFYVLTTPEEGDTSINLIMDQNINSDGTPAGVTAVNQTTNASQYNLVNWNAESGQSTNNSYGPVTAMNFLYNATKDWTNIPPLNYTYNDKNIQGTTQSNTSYISFVSINGVAVITALDETISTTIGSETEPLRARMPIYSSDVNITEVADKTNSNEYLYENMPPNSNNGPGGYWTLSTISSKSTKAWAVPLGGVINEDSLWFEIIVPNAVRPVITLKL